MLEHRLHAALDEALGDSTRTGSQLAHGGRLVFFGYPVAYGSDARRAVDAALRVWSTVAEWDARARAEGRGGLQVRVGVHTGVVLTGRIAGCSRFAAGRRAGAGRGDRSRARRRGRPDPRERCDVATARRTLPGPHDPRRSTLVILGRRRRGRDRRWHRATPMVGRQLELGLLLSSLEAARDGESQTVARQRRSRHRQVATGAGIDARAVGARRRVARVPLLAVLPEHALPPAGRSGARPCSRARSAARSAAPLDTSRRRRPRRARSASTRSLIHSLASLASLGGADPSGIQRLSPMMRRERTIHAVVALLHARAATRPIVLAIEDLHWADPSTLELLDELSVLRQAALLAVLTARLDFTPSWRAPAGVTPLQLRRLSRADVARLIAEVAERTLPPELTDLVERSTDGVPLFVEELARLVAEREPASVSEAIRSGTIPTTLREALSARLDRLGPARALAEAAAVLGGEFTAGRSRGLAGGDGSLDARLQELVRANVLQPRRVPPQTRYSFQHALLRDEAYRIAADRDAPRAARARGPRHGRTRPAASPRCWRITTRRAASHRGRDPAAAGRSGRARALGQCRGAAALRARARARRGRRASPARARTTGRRSGARHHAADAARHGLGGVARLCGQGSGSRHRQRHGAGACARRHRDAGAGARALGAVAVPPGPRPP